MVRRLIFLFLVSAFSSGSPLWASTRPGAPALEVYSATENEEGTDAIGRIQVAPTLPAVDANSSVRIRKNAVPKSLPHQLKAPAPRLVARATVAKVAVTRQKAGRKAETAVAKPAPAEFDVVPADQLTALSKRLRLVEEIMTKSSRAYDYRSHTVKDLETILAQLDSSHVKTAPGLAEKALPVAAPDRAPVTAPEPEMDIVEPTENLPAPPAPQP